MFHRTELIGHLGADPEMRYTANGSAVTTFRVAVSESWTGNDGERKELTEWYSVVSWNRQAETCAQYLKKGSRVFVEGRMRTRSWDDRDTGEKRYRTELIASGVRFLDRAPGRSYAGAEQYDGPRGGGHLADEAMRHGATVGGFAPGMAVGPDSGGDIDPDELPF